MSDFEQHKVKEMSLPADQDYIIYGFFLYTSIFENLFYGLHGLAEEIDVQFLYDGLSMYHTTV